MPVPLFQMDAHNLLAFMQELRDQGVTDLEPHFDDNPETLTRTMEAVRIAEVDRSAIQLFGG